MDPISMDTATSPTTPDPGFSRPPSWSPQLATRRDIRVTTTGGARTRQTTAPLRSGAQRRRGDGGLS